MLSKGYWLPKPKIKYRRTRYRVTRHVVRNIQDRGADNRKKRAALMRIRKIINEQVTMNHPEHAFKDGGFYQIAVAHMANVLANRRAAVRRSVRVERLVGHVVTTL